LTAGIDANRIRLGFNPGPEIFKQQRGAMDILQLRYIGKGTGAIGQKGRNQYRQSGIFRSADVHFTLKRAASFDDNFIHKNPFKN